MRFTNKDGTICYFWDKRNEPEEIYKQELANKKLSQLEDIEEELGIDLITLFKALTKGVWVKKNNKCYHLHKMTMILEGMFLVDLQLGEESHELFYFKDYGKTWSLNKKDLEDLL